MGAQSESSNDAKGAAPTAFDCPEKVGITAGVDDAHLAVGSDDLSQRDSCCSSSTRTGDHEQHLPSGSSRELLLAGTGNSISTWIVDTEILSGGHFRLPSKQWLEFIRNAVD